MTGQGPNRFVSARNAHENVCVEELVVSVTVMVELLAAVLMR